MNRRPNLLHVFHDFGDIRVLLSFLQQYQYSIDEINEVCNSIPFADVEHIEVLCRTYPECTLSLETVMCLAHEYPETFERVCHSKPSLLQLYPFLQ